MTSAPNKELDIPVPDYVDRFLAAVAKKTGRGKEEVALFFLSIGRNTPFGRKTPRVVKDPGRGEQR